MESSFRSQDIQVFIMTFLSRRKNSFIRKIMLVSELMTSQPGKQTIVMHISSNISSKGNQTIKLHQLIEYNKRNNFLQNLCRK